AGFALWGLGVSVLFPLLYGAAGSLDALGPGGGLAIMSVGARMGFLVEPPTVGWLAERSHLARGLAIAVGGALAAAALGGRVLRARGLVDRA
ncbi:MAG: MFS transporter, partial [Acidimicrobiia bacterium]|nr:MFS transporter [Acidimicrobiia bacterium]